MLDKIKGFFTKKANHQTNTPQIKSLDLMDEITFGTHYPIISKNYDGEKTQGELGIITKNVIDFNAIRLRAHDAELKIDSIKTILSRYSTWIIGTGLKLQSEPNEDILKIEKDHDEAHAQRIRKRVHFAMAGIMLIIIVV